MQQIKSRWFILGMTDLAITFPDILARIWLHPIIYHKKRYTVNPLYLSLADSSSLSSTQRSVLEERSQLTGSSKIPGDCQERVTEGDSLQPALNPVALACKGDGYIGLVSPSRHSYGAVG